MLNTGLTLSIVRKLNLLIHNQINCRLFCSEVDIICIKLSNLGHPVTSIESVN